MRVKGVPKGRYQDCRTSAFFYIFVQTEYAFTSQLEPISSFVTMTGMNFLMPPSQGGRAEVWWFSLKWREGALRLVNSRQNRRSPTTTCGQLPDAPSPRN